MKIRISKNTYWNPLILIRNLFVVACILFLIWVAASYGEIVLKNLSPGPEYSDWNLFVKIMYRM